MAFPDNIYELLVGVVGASFVCVAVGYFLYLILNAWRLSYYDSSGSGFINLILIIIAIIAIIVILAIYLKYKPSNSERRQKKLNKREETFEKEPYTKAYNDVKKLTINKRKILSNVYNIENDEIESIASFLSANCKFKEYNSIIELFTYSNEEDIISLLDYTPYIYVPNGIYGNDEIKKKCPVCGKTVFVGLKTPIKDGGKITVDNFTFECKQCNPGSFTDLAEKYGINHDK